MNGPAVGIACCAIVAVTVAAAAVEAARPTLALTGLAGVAVGAAVALDDAAAAVTDALPRTARRRVLGQVPVAGLALLAWLVGCLLLELVDGRWPLLLQAAIGTAVWLASFGAAALARHLGIDQPGEPIGTTAGSVVLLAVLVGPSIAGIAPFTADARAMWWWTAPVVGGVAALAFGTRDRMLAAGPLTAHRQGDGDVDGTGAIACDPGRRTG